MIQRIIKLTSLPAFAGLALLLGGCTTPDLKPFADSTASLHQAMTQSKTIISSELNNIEQAPGFEPKDKVEAVRKKLDAAFDTRIAFMAAVASYSDSLAAVAAAGKNGQADAKALGDSLQQLADMAGPYGAAVGGGAEIASQIYGLIAEARAAHSLREITAKMDPAIQKAAVLMQMDMANASGILKNGVFELNDVIQTPYQPDVILRNHLNRFSDLAASEIPEDYTATNYPDKLVTYNQKMVEVDKMMERIDKWYLPLQAQETQNLQRFATETDLVNSTIRGFQQWAKAHADVVKALQDNRQPNIGELVSTVLEIKTEIENLKKH